jgi:8-oxo-dGTP pyrophosphatase MutT (NUDIX family)
VSSLSEAPRESAAISIVPLSRLEQHYTPRRWPFAEDNREKIEVYFNSLWREKPALFNGCVLLSHEQHVADGVLYSRHFDTDFASMLAWRDWGFPDRTVHNCFALGALESADGAYLMGVMAGHTSNANRVYFPGGTPDLSDVFDGRLDLEASVIREVEEETGLRRDDYDLESGWYAAFAGARTAMLKVMRVNETAARIRERILRHLSRQSEPELADIRIVRGLRDLDEAMPPFIHAFLHQRWMA